jgi:hypothetical protein
MTVNQVTDAVQGQIDSRAVRSRVLLVLAPVVVALCCAFALGAAPAIAAANFSLETHFGAEGTGSGQFKTPHGVAVESATGDVFVVDQKNNRVEKWEREVDGGYKAVGEITYPEFQEPSAVAVDNSSGSFKGYVYVASGNTTGSGAGTVDQFKPKVSDPDEYEFVRRIEAPNAEPNIGAVTVDPTTGDVGIAAANFVDVYNPSTGEPIPGEPLNETGHTVTGLALDGAHAYVTTSVSKSGELLGALERWGLNGKYELKDGRTVLFEEATSTPKLTGLTLDSSGDAYVIVEESAGKSHVDVFVGVEAASGLIVPTEFGTGEIGPSHGIGWSSDNGGIVYVSNPASNDVLVFGPPPPPPSFPLTLAVYGEGTVTSNPVGIECGQTHTTCEASFEESVVVKLEEKPATGYSFAGWLGCKKASATTCEVTISKATEVSAAFVKEGTEGKNGKEGTDGKEGAPGVGLEGPQGAEGRQGPAGAEGKQGPAGGEGKQGAAGPAGPAGAQGPAGKEGPAGKVELVTCKTPAKGKKAQKCTTKLVSGTVQFQASALSARLRNHQRQVASGKVWRNGATTQLLLSVARPLPSGTYTLVWGTTSRRGGHGGLHSERVKLQ